MDFRDSLANDTTDSLNRALARRTEQSRRGLEAFRKSLDDALLSLDSALKTVDEHEPDAEISGLVERLTAAMTAHAQSSADLVRAEAGKVLAIAEKKCAAAEAMLAERGKTLGETEQKFGEAEEKIRTMLVALEDQRQRHDALVTSMADLQGQLDTLQGELDAERELSAGATKELVAAISAQQQAQTAAQDAEAARRQHEHARKALERELLEVREALDRARTESASVAARLEASASERASLQAALVDLRGRIEEGESERAALTDQLDQRAARIERLEQMVKDAEGTRRELQVKFDAAAGREAMLRERIVGAEVEASEARAAVESMTRMGAVPNPMPVAGSASASAPLDFDRLIAAYQELESGISVAAVLTALTKGLRGQFARVALFSVSGNALQGSYQLGFEISKDITKIVMPLTMESVLTRAFASGRLETSASDSPLDRVGLPFGGASGWCMALPVVLRGETIAVIYADHGEQVSCDEDLQPSRMAFAELLRRHAIPVLVKLTVDLRARSELRAYAMLLLDEVEYVYGADVSSGKKNVDLVERLTGNLRCAQEAYARRLESVPQPDGGPDLFDERLNTVLDTKGATAFGRHLSVAAAAIVRVTPPSDEPTASQPAAQAS